MEPALLPAGRRQPRRRPPEPEDPSLSNPTRHTVPVGRHVDSPRRFGAFWPLVNGLVVIVALLLAGVVLGRSGALPAAAAETLNRFVLHVTVPALVLLRVPSLTLSRSVLWPVLLPWITLAVAAALVLAYARLRGLDRPTTAVLLMMAPLGNTSFLGFPMVETLLGSDALPYAVVYDQFGSFVAVTTYGSLVLARYGTGGGPSARALGRRLITFPPLVAFVVAMATRGVPYPTPLVLVLEALAATLLPLIMIAIGLQLRLRLPEADRMSLAFGLAVKMVVVPALALAICRTFGAHDIAARASILEAGMPPMVTAGVLASSAGLVPRLAAALVGLGLLLSFVTLPLLARLL
jgi:hypothetical protein